MFVHPQLRKLRYLHRFVFHGLAQVIGHLGMHRLSSLIVYSAESNVCCFFELHGVCG